MRIAFASTLVCLTCVTFYAGATERDPIRMLATAPLRFEPAPDGSAGRFTASGLRFHFSFERDGAALQAGGKTVRLRFDGASGARIEGIDKMQSTTNVFRGNDPRKWHTGIANYRRLQVQGLYQGVDLVYYGNGRELEYDLVVKPGSDTKQIRLRFEGARPHIDREGNLVAGFIQKRPVAYQLAASGARVPVESHYRRNADGSFGFALGRYDHARAVVIDPTLTLSVYLAGSQLDSASAIGHDAPGFIYVAGTTQSTDFAIGGSVPAGALGGNSDVFLAVLDPNAPRDSQVVNATYLGGTAAEELSDMVVTPQGNVYLTGITSSTDFPTVNPVQSALSGTSDAFVMWLNPLKTSDVIYSTYLGGSSDDIGSGIAVDKTGRIFVTGTTKSSDFPATNGFQPGAGSVETAFVTGIDPAQNTIFYSSYIGGTGGEFGRSVAVAPDGTIWVVGGTFSGTDFPVAGFTYQTAYGGSGDAFVVQIDPSISGSGSELYGTYLGGSGPDEAKKVIVDSFGRVIVAGYTGSADFPVTSNAMQTNYGGNFDAFVTILNPKNPPTRSSQAFYSTFFGGNQPDIPYDLKQDAAGNLYLTGFTMSPDMPVSGNALQPVYNLSLDAFALSFNPARSGSAALNYSSYVSSSGQQIGYGVDFGANGTIYVAGFSTGAIFAGIGGVSKSTSQGNTDAFVIGVNPCEYTLSKPSSQFPSQGGSDTIALTTSAVTCTWSVLSHVDWIGMTPTAGTGSGSVTVTAAPNNTGASRSATVSIAGVSFVAGQN
jgi:Beta-propeller repeat/Viral BACON domain